MIYACACSLSERFLEKVALIKQTWGNDWEVAVWMEELAESGHGTHTQFVESREY